MERTEIVSLYKNTPADGTVVTVCGWAKNIRDSKNIGFIALSDGGCFKTLLAVLAAAMSLVLSGCFVKTVDELYTLPKHSDEYNRLEQAIDQVMSSQNASYAAPVSGMNQQSVQLADLDGDGTEEAVAFLKTTGDKPLKACIFSRVDEDYQLMDVIEGDGTSFASVEYVPLTGGPGVELVIGRQLSTDVLQSLCAYSYTGGH